jgi:Overcoming lysogenization defect protein-like, TOPRIM domain
MGMTYEDWARDEAISALHDEAVMERAAREQAIFLFVEGESEEIGFPYLLEGELNLDAMGVKIANYNGHGNLHAALRLLKKTLSHDRPVIVTYDNDPESSRSVQRCKEQGLLGDKVYVLPVPCEEVVAYRCGHRGGTFEESFPIGLFLNEVFSPGVLPAELIGHRVNFESRFDPGRPWLAQVQRFVVDAGFHWTIPKPILAEGLANSWTDLPVTYKRLSQLIKDVRNTHPVIHPDHVDFKLPRGL